MANSLDAVSARDFALEALSALSIAATHLSRLAEEIVLWTSAQFAFAKLSDAWSTGSSIMPQKRNPDAAELVRAKASLITGQFAALQGAVKALPLAYAKDLQDDKQLTFSAFDTFSLCARLHGRDDGDDHVQSREYARRRGKRLLNRHRSCRLAGARAENAIPRCPPCHRLAGRQGRRKGCDLPELSLEDMQSSSRD